MKALRRSIKGEREKAPSHVSRHSKSAIAIVPPKKVIRALYDYEARSAQELSFSKGDFFHVISREDDTDWYEACNPALPDARGLVPVAFFQSLGRTERDSGHSDGLRTLPINKLPDHDSGYGDSHSVPVPAPAPAPISAAISAPISAPMPASGPQSQRGQGPMVYGVVLFDFNAERADELDAKAGEAIIVIAQSNPEWFVAKPIGRLGGPGLIPVSFIEIRDMASDKAIEDPAAAIRNAGVPKVEEWKKMAADYKNSSITLGKFEGGSSSGSQSMDKAMGRLSIHKNGRQNSQQLSPQQQQQVYQQHQHQHQNSVHQQQQQHQQTTPTSLSHQHTQQDAQQDLYAAKSTSQLYAPIRACIPRYCFAEDKYWFVIEAMLEDGRQWELSRYYEDFYDFQIALLTEFPAEAGNTGQQKRTLPYMPGPVNYVTDAITEGRLHNLDAYVKNLLNQPPYISRCLLVKQFFAPREGDYEIENNEEAAAAEEYRHSQESHKSATEAAANGTSVLSSHSNSHSNSHNSSQHNMDNGGYGSLPQSATSPRQMSNGHQHSQSNMTQAQPPAAAMKIKMYYNGDLIALRVPSDIQFQALFDKIVDRLKVSEGEQLQLFYKDEASGEKPNLMSDADLDYALQRNEKLLLYAEIV